jgi:3-dehydroquinate dehydratase/shikimate dehydrogenase
MNNTKLCVPLTFSDEEEAGAFLRDPHFYVDVAEVRLDYFANPDLPKLFEERACPIIATNRSAKDRGHWAGEEWRRLALLEEASSLGAEYVDIEAEHLPSFERKRSTRLIVSYHNFEETPGNIGDIAAEIEQTGGDIVKVATLTRTFRDQLALFRVLQAARKPTIAVGMGEQGHITRILGPKFGAFLVFGSLGDGRESAPGQLPARDLVKIYRFREIGPNTVVYGMAETSSKRTSADAALNAAFRHCRIDAVAFSFYAQDPADLLPFAKQLPMAGLSLAGPLEKTAMPGLDSFEGAANRRGETDTIVLRDGALIGSHTETESGDELGLLARRFEIWTGVPAPTEVLRETLQRGTLE